jgi:hypothetical protein
MSARRRRRVIGLLAGFVAGTLGGYAAGLMRPPRSVAPFAEPFAGRRP